MNFIVAVDENFAIGNNNDLLYHIKKDLAFFKEKTLNKVVVMGEKTYLSLPKRPLKDRVNIVISKDNTFFEGAITVNSLDSLFEKLKEFEDDDIFIIGGASIYNQLIPHCKFGYITKIFAKKEADTFIKNLDKNNDWKVVSKSEIMEEDGLKFQFCIYEKTRG